jgi:hypothetical protein
LIVFLSRFLPCAECGGSVDRTSGVVHTCDPERLVDYRMFRLRAEIETLESVFAEFLETPDGRFQRWLAARDVRRSGQE